MTLRFKGTESMTIEPTKDEVASFEQYTERFKQRHST